MRRVFVLGLALGLFVHRSFGFAEHAGDKDLSELRKMKGVEVIVSEEKDLHWVYSYSSFAPKEAQELVTVAIELLPENDLLGKGHFTGFQHVRLTEAMLYTRDQSGATLSVAKVSIERDKTGGSLSGQDKDNFTQITFIIRKSLLQHSFLRLVESPIRGIQWTDIYFGQKPVHPSKSPEPPLPTEAIPYSPDASGAGVIPGLEEPKAR
ncbi:hypothetical protein ACXR0O_02355 [Verrucomicrobiota bacterium sgz303538]